MTGPRPRYSSRARRGTADTASVDPRRTLDAVLRTRLAAFLRHVFPVLLPGTPFLDNWHLHAMAYHLEQVLAGNIKRLIITVPPRSLKSITGSVVFPAFALGQDPTRRIVAVSYAADLALKHARDSRELMLSAPYRRLFPGTHVSKSKNSEEEFTTTKGGFRLSLGVGGPLTGRGGNLIIVDDPLKPHDAMSDSRRGAANDWFHNTLYSRLDDKSKDALIVIMQRLHPEDLVGHLLERDGWVHLNLPALAQFAEDVPIGPDRVYHRDIGDLLHPERESVESLEATRLDMGTFNFSAQYLQRPVPVDGELIQLSWFRRYWNTPCREADDRIVQSWDTAAVPGKNNDYTVCTTWHIQDDLLYLLGVVRVQAIYPDLKRLVLEQARRWRPHEVLVERSNLGEALFQEFSMETMPGGGRLRGVTASGDKLTRMARFSAIIEAGRVVLPEEAPWLPAFEKEFLLFPNGRYDDQVDSVSQFLYSLSLSPPRYRATAIYSAL